MYYLLEINSNTGTCLGTERKPIKEKEYLRIKSKINKLRDRDIFPIEFKYADQGVLVIRHSDFNFKVITEKEYKEIKAESINSPLDILKDY